MIVTSDQNAYAKVDDNILIKTKYMHVCICRESLPKAYYQEESKRGVCPF